VVEPGSDSVTNTKADIFLKRDLCQAHVPVPLGDNHEQFLQLIRDISERNGQT
jgi:tryptophanyl-tRNA synthetase